MGPGTAAGANENKDVVRLVKKSVSIEATIKKSNRCFGIAIPCMKKLSVPASTPHGPLGAQLEPTVARTPALWIVTGGTE